VSNLNPVQNVLDRLEGTKQTGPDKWAARCPNHDDRHASLSVARGDDGRALLFCHACGKEATPAILAKIGLTLADTFPPGASAGPAPAGKRARPEPPKPAPKKPKALYPTPEAAIEAIGRNVGGTLVPYGMGSGIYHAADGRVVFHALRFNLAAVDPARSKPDKTFRPLRPEPKGWAIADPPGLLPLYHLPELLTADASAPVIVCEGEWKVDTARSLELVATCSAHGAKSAGKTDWRPLAGRLVYILPDNDGAGREYAEEVAAILVRLGARVRIVHLPGLAEGGDLVDWVGPDGPAGCSSAAEIREAILDLGAKAPDWTPKAEVKPGGPVLVCLADVKPVPVKWLWPGRVPLGRITLLVGRPGEGKSFLTTDMAARVTTGTPWPDGSGCPAGTVILISVEDDPGDTIRPRLDAHRANVGKVHLLSGVRCVAEDGEQSEVMFTLADVVELEAAMKTLPDCRLIVVDPIGSFLGGRTDAHRDNEVRGVLAPVAKLAEKYGPAVLVVAHRRKSAGSIADDLALGSRAFTGIARAVWHLSRDPDDKTRRLLLPGKNNLAPEGEGLAFRIIGEPAAIAWERDPVALSADDALAVENGDGELRKPGPQAEARSHAAEWLLDLLKGGPMESAKIKDEATAAGYAWRTVHRAKDELGIRPYREQFGGPWMWKLPPQPSEANPSCHVPSETENLASWHDSGNHGKSGVPDESEVPACQVGESGTVGTVGGDNGFVSFDGAHRAGGEHPETWPRAGAETEETRPAPRRRNETTSSERSPAGRMKCEAQYD